MRELAWRAFAITVFSAMCLKQKASHRFSIAVLLSNWSDPAMGSY